MSPSDPLDRRLFERTSPLISGGETFHEFQPQDGQQPYQTCCMFLESRFNSILEATLTSGTLA